VRATFDGERWITASALTRKPLARAPRRGGAIPAGRRARGKAS
jgi:hypothetical protein